MLIAYYCNDLWDERKYISEDGYLTRYSDNAKIFNSEEEALKYAKENYLIWDIGPALEFKKV